MSALASFTRERLIRFSDCDPAGIVFYPQYFVMFNGLVEDWVDEGLGVGYKALVIDRRIGLPTTVYLLAMALVEVREAAEAARAEDDDGAA